MVVAPVSKVRVAAAIRTTPGALKMNLISAVDPNATLAGSLQT
jgi:hypothetical protein